MSTPTNSTVICPAKESPFSGRLWRVVEVRTPDTNQIMGYELQTYSRIEENWITATFEPDSKQIVEEYNQNTSPV